MQRMLSFSLTVLLLASCSQPLPTEDPPPVDHHDFVDFATSEQLYRGLWLGEDDAGNTLLLDLDAKAPAAKDPFYDVVGTFELSGAAPVEITGRALLPRKTAEARELQAAVTPALPFTASSATEPLWSLSGMMPAGSPPSTEITLLQHTNTGSLAESYTFTATASAKSDLLNSNWKLAEVVGKPILANTAPTLHFGKNTWDGLGGNDGCNSFGGGYYTDGSSLITHNLGGTEMACAEETMAQSAAYLDALDKANQFEIVENTLVLKDASNKTLLSFQAAQ